MSGYKIMGRTLARAQAMQLLFQAEATGRTVEAVLQGDFALSEGPLDAYGRQIALGCADKISEVDALIARHSHGWDVARMPAADRNLLRVATWELRYTNLPASVVINEAVQLAKHYGTDESSGFVNGLLGMLWKEELKEIRATATDLLMVEPEDEGELLIDPEPLVELEGEDQADTFGVSEAMTSEGDHA